jgi:excisionase family DNA binding protein
MTGPGVVVVPLTPDELRALVREAVRVELASVAPASATPAALVDKRTAAHSLGVSSATLDRLVAAGRIPFVKVGDHRRFDCAKVREALETTPATPSTPAQRERIPGIRLLSRKQTA